MGIYRKREFKNKDPKFSAYVKGRIAKFVSQGLCGKCGKAPINTVRSKRACTKCLDDTLRRRQEWWDQNPEKRKKHQNALNAGYRQDIKDRVFGYYGKFCACCGENEPMFLTIDHIGGGGKKHIEEIKKDFTSSNNGYIFYKWLIKNEFPAGFRTLCYNCNSGRWRNGGTCPHQITLLQASQRVHLPTE